MKNIVVTSDGKDYKCRVYGTEDESSILDVFFFWKTSALLAEKINTKKPPLPETFSEPFCCLACGLAHHWSGRGIDAFLLDPNGDVRARIEIKATITEGGFTDVKRDMLFDELIWLSFSNYNSLSFEIFRIGRSDIERYVEASKTNRDRGTVALRKVIEVSGLQAIRQGRLGVMFE